MLATALAIGLLHVVHHQHPAGLRALNEWRWYSEWLLARLSRSANR